MNKNNKNKYCAQAHAMRDAYQVLYTSAQRTRCNKFIRFIKKKSIFFLNSIKFIAHPQLTAYSAIHAIARHTIRFCCTSAMDSYAENLRLDTWRQLISNWNLFTWWTILLNRVRSLHWNRITCTIHIGPLHFVTSQQCDVIWLQMNVSCVIVQRTTSRVNKNHKIN